MGPWAVTREKRIKAIIANSMVPECQTTILMASGADPDHPDISQVDTSSPTGQYVVDDLMWCFGLGDRPLSELAEFFDGMSCGLLRTRSRRRC